MPGQTEFGAADNVFPRMTEPVFRTAENGTTYTQTSGTVIRLAAAHHQQPDRRPDRQQPGGGSRRVDPGADGVLGTADDVLKDGVAIVTGTRADGSTFETLLHPEHGARRGSLARPSTRG
ncbi:MAG: hypothetical protein M0C28_31880 [Candidatus Moduliflexus flocculans]|nr:hypothetical protein [Candidatus Moduliflexus flocculans]